MRKKNRTYTLVTILLVILLLVGLSVMLYPAFSQWWNSNMTTRAVADYDKMVAEMDDDTYERMLAEAHDYNDRLAKTRNVLSNPSSVSGYYDTLDITQTGIMGYVTVPVVNIELPIYHGTSEGVLNIAVGHFQGTSLPIGGASTHAVLSAHRGLPSARLFTDIDRLVVGDTFTITVLREIYTYEVDEILTVLPTELDKLAIIPGEDKVTLMTCTPYGINSHRLLVRAHRVETEYAKSVLVAADCVQADNLVVISCIVLPLVIGLMLYWNISGKRKRTLPFENPLSVLETA